MEGQYLTKSEEEAKNKFLLLCKEGFENNFDEDESNIDNSDEHPIWFDEEKFKRGQEYFSKNRYGILTSEFSGLILLMSEPKGLLILSSTGNSSTKETARKRYVSTIKTVLTWYEIDLSKGSKSWKSIKRVRRLHMNASKQSGKKNQQYITQAETALTVFGFMGFAIIKPHLLGITHDNKEDREGFIHFWAVMCYMLGVQDRFNICLNDLETVEILCNICLRYIFYPLIQIETPEFKHMASVMIEGMQTFLPHVNYESHMFMTRRLCGVPGYLNKEKLYKQIFNENELNFIRELFIERHIYGTKFSTYNINEMDTVQNIDISPLQQMGLEKEETWSTSLNNKKYYQLNYFDRIRVNFGCNLFDLCKYEYGKKFCDSLLSMTLFFLNRY